MQGQRSGRKNKFFYFIGENRYGSAKDAALAKGVSIQSIHNWCGNGRKSRPDCYKKLKDSCASSDSDIPEETKPKSDAGNFQSAYEYLKACACGEVAPDALRIQAAKSILAYEQPKTRAKPESPSPKKMRNQEVFNAEENRRLAYERKAAKVIQLHEERLKNET